MRDRVPGLPTAAPSDLGALIDKEAALDAAVAALSLLDPEKVARMIEVGGRPALRWRPAGFEGLARIVVAQQVSTASAEAIFERLRAAVAPFQPGRMAQTSDETLRLCGLSASKIRTLRSVAEALLTGTLDLDGLAGLSAQDAGRALVAVKGIGPWTAEVFLLFCLGHPDAWPAGDLALQEGARLALGLEHRPDTMALEAIGERWRPFRGAAAYLLWAVYRAHRNGNRAATNGNQAVRKSRGAPGLGQDPA